MRINTNKPINTDTPIRPFKSLMAITVPSQSMIPVDSIYIKSRLNQHNYSLILDAIETNNPSYDHILEYELRLPNTSLQIKTRMRYMYKIIPTLYLPGYKFDYLCTYTPIQLL